MDPVWTCRPFLCNHTFDCFPVRDLVCKEVLYVSDRSTRSHYQLGHPNNAGAEVVGEIVVDFSFLRTEGLIQPIDGGFNKNGKRVGRRHYRVTYTMVIKVIDRDLRCKFLRRHHPAWTGRQLTSGAKVTQYTMAESGRSARSTSLLASCRESNRGEGWAGSLRLTRYGARPRGDGWTVLQVFFLVWLLLSW